MSIQCIIISHDDIGQSLVEVTKRMFGRLPIATTIIPITYLTDLEQTLTLTQQMLNTLADHSGVLILTDLFGASPNNLARRLMHDKPIHVLSGLNLPMLIKVMNYAHLPLLELATKAIDGGKEGVFNCTHHEIMATL